MATAGYGTQLKLNGTQIAECRNITGPNLTLGTVETTHHTSIGAFREYVSTLLDAGEISFELNFLPAGATHDVTTGLLHFLVTHHATAQTYTLILTDAALTTWTFTAFITAFALVAPVDGKLTANVTLKVTGQPTLA